MDQRASEGGRRTGVCRRDVLKALGASVVGVATGALSGWANGAADKNRIPIAKGRETAMNSRPLMIRHGPPEAIAALGRGEVVDPGNYYFRTVPSFETSADTYAFLNRIITIGAGEARPDGAIHRIDEIL